MSGVARKVPCKASRDRCIVVISTRAIAVKHTFASEYCVSNREGEAMEGQRSSEVWEEDEAWEASCNGGATVRWIIDCLFVTAIKLELFFEKFFSALLINLNIFILYRFTYVYNSAAAHRIGEREISFIGIMDFCKNYICV